MVKVYGYIRVSTKGQVKEGYSIAEQKSEIIKYCNDNKYELVNIFSDEGISGAKVNEEEMSIEGRDGLLDLLAGLKENDIKYVVVLSTSRLWRSDFVKVIIHRELKRHHVDVKAIDRESYSIYVSRPSDILINGMFELLDLYERVEIKLKLKRGRIQKAKGGGYSGGAAPFGYFSLRGSKRLKIEPKEAEIVKRVYELKEYCPWFKLKDIAETLNTEGYKGRRGSKINIMLIKRILDKEEFYKARYYKYGNVEVTKVEHEAIL